MGARTTKDAVKPTTEEEPKVLRIHGALSPKITNATAQQRGAEDEPNVLKHGVLRPSLSTNVQQRDGAASSGNASPVAQTVDSNRPLPGTAQSDAGLEPSKHHAPVDKMIALLGAGDTGKSTFANQMVYKQKPLTESDRRHFVLPILFNAMMAFRNLIIVVKKDPSFLHEEPLLLERALRVITSYIHSGVWSRIEPSSVTILQQVWRLPDVQLSYWDRGRSQMKMPSPLPEVLENLELLNRADYLPSVDEVIKTTLRTTEPDEKEIQLDGVNYRFLDVGGQRKERTQWNSIIDVSCIVFFSALGAFDEVIDEDSQTMCLHEDLSLWKGVVKNKRLQHIPKCLVFTKMDIFHQKSISFVSLHQIIGSMVSNFPAAVAKIIYVYLAPNKALSICFPDYVDKANTVDDTIEFVKQKFFEVIDDKSLVDFITLSTIDLQQCEALMELIQRKIHTALPSLSTIDL